MLQCTVASDRLKEKKAFENPRGKMNARAQTIAENSKLIKQDVFFVPIFIRNE